MEEHILQAALDREELRTLMKYSFLALSQFIFVQNGRDTHQSEGLNVGQNLNLTTEMNSGRRGLSDGVHIFSHLCLHLLRFLSIYTSYGFLVKKEKKDPRLKINIVNRDFHAQYDLGR